MVFRQQYVVVELGGDLEKLCADKQKIDHEVVLIQSPIDLGGDMIVVPVKPFAIATKVMKWAALNTCSALAIRT